MRIYRVHPADLDSRPVVKTTRLLTASEQDELRDLYARGWHRRALTTRYGISQRTLYRYLQGELVEGRVGDYTATFWLRKGYDPVRIESWALDEVVA